MNDKTLYEIMRQGFQEGWMGARMDTEGTLILWYKPKVAKGLRELDATEEIRELVITGRGEHPYDAIWNLYDNASIDISYDGNWGQWLEDHQGYPSSFAGLYGNSYRSPYQRNEKKHDPADSFVALYEIYVYEMAQAAKLRAFFGADTEMFFSLFAPEEGREEAEKEGDPWAKDWKFDFTQEEEIHESE